MTLDTNKQPKGTTILSDNRISRFDDEFIEKYFNERGKQAIRDYVNERVTEELYQAWMLKDEVVRDYLDKRMYDLKTGFTTKK